MKHNFDESRNNRAERYAENAQKNKKKAETKFKNAEEIGSAIPFGQPILPGHHSEKRHRRDLEKIDNSMRQGVEAEKKAEYYRERLAAMESNTAISSDDPEALTKLQKKLEMLSQIQDFMKAANKCIKKKDKDKFLTLNYGTDELWERLITPDFCKRIGFPRYKLTNNGANIRSIKARISQLEKISNRETKENTIKGIRVVENVEANRVQLFFPSIPSEETRTKLRKGYSFIWCPSEGAWQRFLNNAGIWAAKSFLEEYTPEN